MGRVRALVDRLERFREISGEWPACNGVHIGECEALLGMEGPPLEVFDGWERPMFLLSHPSSPNALLLSGGRDGEFELDIGGPYLRSEPWRDLAYLLEGEGHGTWFQYPEGYQCGCQCPFTIREWVTRDRKRSADAHDREEPLWQLHSEFVGDGADGQ